MKPNTIFSFTRTKPAIAFSMLLAATMVVFVQGRSLSYRFKLTEKEACFYAVVSEEVDFTADPILQFYFSASDVGDNQIVHVDSIVKGPAGNLIYTKKHQSHAEINVKTKIPGEYSLCLTHTGRPSNKDIDIDIALPSTATKKSKGAEGEGDIESKTKAKLEKTVKKLKRELVDLVHTLRYIKNRERRNLNTVSAVGSWMFWISFLEVLLVGGMAVVQIWVVRKFFNRPKHRL